MARAAWVFYDPITTASYPFPVNPFEDGGSHSIGKGTLYESVSGLYQELSGSADRIGTIVAAGPDNPEPFSYNGRAYNQTEITQLEIWCEKNYPVHLTDDLGRTWLVAIETFQTRRVPGARNNPFKHSYTLSGWVLAEIEDATP